MKISLPDRSFLKAHLWDIWERLETDQKKGLRNPPLQKPLPEETVLIDLVPAKDFQIPAISLQEAIQRRRSRRNFTSQPLNLQELSFLLWATQGVQEVLQNGTTNRRTVPSAGSRHPFETYLLVHRVEGLEVGVYRYLALEHQLAQIYTDPDLAEKSRSACTSFAGQAAVVFAWTVIPYRTEWRYGAIAIKLIAQDTGHVCQNLYLAVEAIGAGTCAVGAYMQDEMDTLLKVDRLDEFTIYCAPVGKVNQ
jgi:SagB-type dehydrogenase family enzyme